MTQKIHHYPLVLSALLAFIGLTIVGQIYIPVPILAKISQDFNVDSSMAGITSSAFSIGYSIGFLLFGPLSDRFGKKFVILIGLTLFTITTCVMGFCTDFTFLIFLRVVQGFLASSYPPVILSYLNNNIEPEWRTRAISFMSLGFLAASIIAQLYALSMEEQSFNALQLSLLPLYVLSIIFISFSLSNQKSNRANSSLLGIYKMIPFLLFKVRYLYLSTLCTLSALIAFYVVLDSSYHAEFPDINITLFTLQLIVLPVMLLSLFSPQLIKKIGAIPLVRWSFIIASVGLIMASLAVFWGNSWALLLASMVFIGGRSFSLPSLISAIGAQVSAQYSATAISLYTFILFLGASMGVMLGRWLLYFNHSLSFFILAVIAGIPALLTLFIKKETNPV